MVEDRIHCILRAVDEVDHALRKADLFNELENQLHRHRHFLRWFDDISVAARDSVGHVPCERRCGMNASEIRKTLREMRANPARARAVGKKTQLTIADFEEMEETIKSAMRKVAAIEMEARSTAPDLRSTFRD